MTTVTPITEDVRRILANGGSRKLARFGGFPHLLEQLAEMRASADLSEDTAPGYQLVHVGAWSETERVDDDAEWLTRRLASGLFALILALGSTALQRDDTHPDVLSAEPFPGARRVYVHHTTLFAVAKSMPSPTSREYMNDYSKCVTGDVPLDVVSKVFAVGLAELRRRIAATSVETALRELLPRWMVKTRLHCLVGLAAQQLTHHDKHVALLRERLRRRLTKAEVAKVGPWLGFYERYRAEAETIAAGRSELIGWWHDSVATVLRGDALQQQKMFERGELLIEALDNAA